MVNDVKEGQSGVSLDSEGCSSNNGRIFQDESGSHLLLLLINPCLITEFGEAFEEIEELLLEGLFASSLFTWVSWSP